MSDIIAKTLSDAKEGYHLWVLDKDAPRYVDGSYAGRGEYHLSRIERVTRQSFYLAYNGYELVVDRHTGVQRGVKSGYPREAYGSEDRNDRDWRLKNVKALARHIEHFSGDRSILMQVAKITGFEEKE